MSNVGFLISPQRKRRAAEGSGHHLEHDDAAEEVQHPGRGVEHECPAFKGDGVATFRATFMLIGQHVSPGRIEELRAGNLNIARVEAAKRVRPGEEIERVAQAPLDAVRPRRIGDGFDDLHCFRATFRHATNEAELPRSEQFLAVDAADARSVANHRRRQNEALVDVVPLD